MCEHDWKEYSKTADGYGDLYIYYICELCGETKEVVVDDLVY